MILTDYQRNLMASKYLKFLVNGKLSEISFEVKQLEHDGRKGRKFQREALSDGYIARMLAEDKFLVTHKAYSEIEPHRPNLEQHCPVDNAVKHMHYIGVEFDGLGLPERKYIFLHPEEYTNYLYDSYNRSSKEITLGDQDAWNASFVRYNIMHRVADAAYKKKLEEVRFSVKLEEMKAENFVWGLETFGIIASQEDCAYLNTYLQTLPNDWGTRLLTTRDALVEQCNRSTKTIQVIEQTLQRLNEFGGWDKFLAAYNSAILRKMEQDGK